MPRLKRPSPSMVVALLALTVALSGTATAATVLIQSSSQIKDGAVAKADIARDAINSPRVKDGSLSAADLSKAAVKGIGPTALEAVRTSGPEKLPADASAKIVTLELDGPGAYAIFAKTVLTAPSNDSGALTTDQSIGGHCILDAAGDTDQAFSLLGSPGALAPAQLSMQLTRNFSQDGTATLSCDVSSESWRADETSIIAIRLASAARVTVDG